MAHDHEKIIFNQILKELIKPVFKVEGFATSGRTFRKPENGFTKIFNIQCDSRDPKNVDFIFNIGFFIPYVHDLQYLRTLAPDKINEASCCYRTRVSQLGYEYEKWFTLTEKTKFKNIKSEVTKAVKVSIDLFRSIKSIHDLLKPPEKYKDKFKHSLISDAHYLGIGLALIKLGDQKLGMELFSKGYSKFIELLRKMKKIREEKNLSHTYPEDRWKILVRITNELKIPLKDKNYY